MTWFGRAVVPLAVAPESPPDTEADRLVTNILAAIAKVDAILAGWALTRTEHRTPRETGLSDGLLEVRSRLVNGLPREMR